VAVLIFFLVGGTSTQIGESWGNSDPCPSLLDGALRSSHPPNKEAGHCAWGGRMPLRHHSDAIKAPLAKVGGRWCACFFSFFFSFPCVRRIGGKVTLVGLKRWFSPRGQDLAFLMSCILM
jgi:hypothetical protein